MKGKLARKDKRLGDSNPVILYKKGIKLHKGNYVVATLKNYSYSNEYRMVSFIVDKVKSENELEIVIVCDGLRNFHSGDFCPFVSVNIDNICDFNYCPPKEPIPPEPRYIEDDFGATIFKWLKSKFKRKVTPDTKQKSSVQVYEYDRPKFYSPDKKRIAKEAIEESRRRLKEMDK